MELRTAAPTNPPPRRATRFKGVDPDGIVIDVTESRNQWSGSAIEEA